MKTQRKKVVAFLAALVFLVAVFLLIPPRLETVRGLTRHDVAEIHRTVRKEVWKEFRRDYSRPGWGHVPGDLFAAFRTRITVVDFSVECTATACTRTRSRPFEGGQYDLQKRGERWVVIRGGKVLFSLNPAANEPWQPTPGRRLVCFLWLLARQGCILR